MSGPLCAGHPDPEIFFDEEHPAAAKAVCAVCPARAACARVGAAEPWGIFAGLTAAERLGDVLLLAGMPEPAPERHGTRGRYVHGCHCPDCTAANSAYVDAWRHRDAGVTAGATVDPCEQLTIGWEATG